MKKTLNYILLMLLLPGLGFSQIVISGDGEIVATGTADIVLTGDWTNDAATANFTASQGAGSVIFKGSSAQTVGGSEYTSFYNLTLDNSAGLTSGKFVFIHHMLFSNGIFTTTSTNSVYIYESGDVSGAGSNKFFNGPLAKAGDTDFKFDIGSGTKYAPVNVSALSASTVVQATYNLGAGPDNDNFEAPLTKISDVEYWFINDIDRGFPIEIIDAKIEIFWEDAAESGIYSIHTDSLKFARLDGGKWYPEVANNYSLDGSTGSVASTPSFELNELNVTFGSTNNTLNPLPVNLLSYTAQCQKQDVVLNWSTASEENNDYFTVLRSEDAENYEEIAQISGAGNSNGVLNYNFNDRNAANGINYYYSLKQTDYDGKSETFSAVHANCSQEKEVTLKLIYDGDIVYALLSNAQSGSNYNMMIIDHTGRILVQQKQNVNTQNYYRIPKDGLATGLYSIIYFSDDGSTRLNEKVFIR